MSGTATTTSFTRGENPLRADKLNQALSERVAVAGDVMGGFLTLHDDPTQPFHAATKQYVDTISYSGLPPEDSPYLLLTGGTVTAPTHSTVPILTLLTSDNGVTCNNGLEVVQGYAGGNLAMGHGLTPHTASVRMGTETFHDHFAKIFNTPARATGQYNNLESVLTIPATQPATSLLSAFGSSVVNYSAHTGALAGTFYATAGVSDCVVFALNTVCTDSFVTNNNPGPFNNVREQIECDYFVRNNTTTVRGTLNVLSSTVPQLNAASWYAFSTGVFGGKNTLAFVGATGTFTVGLVVTGGTSHATATITNVAQTGATGTLTLSNIIGYFSSGETITDTGTGAGTANDYASALSFPWSVGYISGNGSAGTAFVAGSKTASAITGDWSQDLQFLYTDNTTAATRHAVRIYADPRFAGPTGTDLRITADYAGRVNPTLDNLAYLKAMNAAGTATLPLMVLTGQDQLSIGDGVQTVVIRGNAPLGSIAQFVSVPSGVNDIVFTGAVAGGAPTIASFHGAGGTDTNIGLDINAFGTGIITLGSPTRINGNVGFNTAPITKPTAGGAWAGNTAGKALSTALAALGLITDTSTA